MGTCLYTSLGGGGGGLPGPSSFQKRAGGLLRDREAPETGRWMIMIQSVSHQEGRLDPGRGPAGFYPLLRFASQRGRAGVVYRMAYAPKSVPLCCVCRWVASPCRRVRSPPVALLALVHLMCVWLCQSSKWRGQVFNFNGGGSEAFCSGAGRLGSLGVCVRVRFLFR